MGSPSAPSPHSAPPETPASQPTAASDPKAIWQNTLTAVSKAEPPLFGLLRGERFLGAKGNVYQLLIPFAKKDFSYMKLNQTARKEKISQILSQVAGETLIFEPVLEGDLTHERAEATQDRVQTMLVEAFGRDLVQIDDGEGGA
jgi:hypothetical protein